MKVRYGTEANSSCSATISSSLGIVISTAFFIFSILRHERHGPENNLRLPQIRVLFPRLPAARKKDGGQDSWLGRSLPSPNPPLFAPGRQSHVRRHPPP